MDGVRKQQTVIKMKRERLNSQIDALSAEIAALDNELQSAKQKREEAFNTMKQIRKLLSKKVCSCFHINDFLLGCQCHDLLGFGHCLELLTTC